MSLDTQGLETAIRRAGETDGTVTLVAGATYVLRPQSPGRPYIHLRGINGITWRWNGARVVRDACDHGGRDATMFLLEGCHGWRHEQPHVIDNYQGQANIGEQSHIFDLHGSDQHDFVDGTYHDACADVIRLYGTKEHETLGVRIRGGWLERSNRSYLGIHAGCGDISVSQVSMYDVADQAIDMEQSPGVDKEPSGDVRVMNCHLETRHKHAVAISGMKRSQGKRRAKGVILIGNTIRGSIGVIWSDQVILANNHIFASDSDRSTHGILIHGTVEDLKAYGNTIVAPEADDCPAIAVTSAHGQATGIRLSDNTIYSQGKAIDVHGGSQLRIKDNTCYHVGDLTDPPAIPAFRLYAESDVIRDVIIAGNHCYGYSHFATLNGRCGIRQLIIRNNRSEHKGQQAIIAQGEVEALEKENVWQRI